MALDKHKAFESARLLCVKAWATIGVIVLGVMTIVALGHLSDAIELLFFGTLIGFIISPITNWLEDHHVPRGVAAFLGLLCFLVVLGLIANLILPPFIDQALSLAKRIPEYSQVFGVQITEFLEAWGQNTPFIYQVGVADVVNAFNKQIVYFSQMLVTRLSTGIVLNIISTINFLVIFFLGLVMAYWLARDYPKIIREFAIIAGPDHKNDVLLLFAVLSRSIGGYMRGIVIMALVDGILSFIGFLLIGHPYAGLMATLVGLLSFIPVVGPWMSALIAAFVALFVSPLLALESILVVVLIKNATDNLIYPLVMQSAVKVHPALSLLAIAVGAALSGVIGMTLAIPLSAAIKGVFVYYFETKTGRQLVSESGALFKSTPFIDKNGNILPAFDALDDAKFFETSRLVSEPGVAFEALKEKPDTREKLDIIVDTLQGAWKNSKSNEKGK